jgi:hypothetical protein
MCEYVGEITGFTTDTITPIYWIAFQRIKAWTFNLNPRFSFDKPWKK